MDKSRSNKSWSDVVNHGAAKKFSIMHKTGTTIGVIGVELKTDNNLKV